MSNIINNFKLLEKQIILDFEHSEGSEKSKHMFRLKSIQNVIKILTNLNKETITLNDLEELKKIKGIGSHTILRIKEIMETNKLKEIVFNVFDSIKDIVDSNKYKKIYANDDYKFLDYLDKILNVFGIGYKTAYKLYKDYNITSIEQLKEYVDTNKIDVPEQIKIGLKYIDKINDSIDRNIIDDIKEYLLEELYTIDVNLFGTICGSYRRLKQKMGDIDMIITHPNPNKKINYLHLFITKLKENNFIIESFNSDEVKTKYMGICKWKDESKFIRIDIRYIPYKSYYYALLYFTGSKDFNRKMRLIAISNGYKLNEYGLYNSNNKSFRVDSEKDIFDLLQLDYITPNKR